MDKHKHYFVRLLGTREDWPKNMTAAEEEIMGEHFVYLKELVEKGRVLMAGPVFDPVFGLVILRTQSEKEARKLMDNEPSVAGGIHTYTISEMRVSLLAKHTNH
jgi:uncharacterized protein YciI